MAPQATVYDLTLMLSEAASEDQRAKVLRDVESAISQAGGSIERNDNWGRRPMAYEIRHQPEAEYHLLQFTAPGELIGELSRTLRITDGVLRFRTIKVRPGTPDAPSSPPPVVAGAHAASPGSGAGSGGGGDTAAGRPAAPEPAAAPPADESPADTPPAAAESAAAESGAPAE